MKGDYRTTGCSRRRRAIGTSPAHRRLRLALLLLAVACVGGWLVALYAGLPVTRGIGFRIIMGLVAAANLTWWSFADEVLIRLVRARRARAVVRVLLGVGAVAVMGPFAIAAVIAELPRLTEIPTEAAAGFQLWHMGIFLLVPIATIVGYAVVALVAVARLWWHRNRSTDQRADRAGLCEAGASPATASIESGTDGGLTRRELLKAAAIYAPVAILGGTGLVGGRQTGRFAINRYDLPAPWLPDRLRGLTITHISDLHVGRLYRPSMLPHLVEQANRLDGDIVVVTGDVIDHSNDMLPAALDAIGQLQHRHGLFLCIGNHDLIDDGEAFVRAVRGAGLDLLIDERRSVAIGGERLTIGGLDWGRRRSGHAGQVRRMLWGHDAERDGPCIALAHHPHAFDDLATAGVPLTLAGHTHGGQLMFRPPRLDGRGEADRDHGVGRMLFRYVRGFYHRDDSTLFVNSGVGNWFPLRVNAPAEIVQLRLV